MKENLKLYNVSDRELLGMSITVASVKETDVKSALTLDELSQKAEGAARRLWLKGTSYLETIYRRNEELLSGLDGETRLKVSNELSRMLAKRDRSRSGLVGSLVRNGRIKAEHVNLGGYLRTEDLEDTPFFQNNAHLLEVLEGYRLNSRSKILKEARQSNGDYHVVVDFKRQAKTVISPEEEIASVVQPPPKESESRLDICLDKINWVLEKRVIPAAATAAAITWGIVLGLFVDVEAEKNHINLAQVAGELRNNIFNRNNPDKSSNTAPQVKPISPNLNAARR